MTVYNNQIPTGTIDNINKVFTLLNSPDLNQTINVWVDGAIYVSYVIVGNILTLTDAPEYSIYISYSTGITNSTINSQDTLGDIITEVWDLLGQTSNSTVFARDKVAKKVNAKIKEVLRGRITSLLDLNKTYRCGKIGINEGTTNFRVQAGSRLTQILNVGDTIAYCDTTNLYSAGYIQLGGDIINYTSKATGEIDGVSGQTVQHLGTEILIQLYEMPANFEKTNMVELVSKGEITYSADENLAVCYNVIRLGSKTLLKIIGVDNNSLVSVTYTKIVYNLVDDADLCILPDDYGIKVIAPLVAGEYAYQKGFPISQQILLSGYTDLQNMYQFFTNTITITKQSIKAQPYSFMALQQQCGNNYRIN